MAGIIELYEDSRSGWRVLASQEVTTGYRFIIVDRVRRTTFAADARQLARGKVPAGLETVDLSVDADHGMELVVPCALWKNGQIERTEAKPGVLTAAYIEGDVLRAKSDEHH